MRKLIALSTFLTITIACNLESTQNQVTNELNAEIELRNGGKWQANPETTEGIENMIHNIENFKQADRHNYDELRDDLFSEFNSIIKKCTMKGEAHEQLHTYLMPLKKEIEDLSADNLDKVQTYLKEYSQYFK